MQILKRPVKPEDFEFLRLLHRAALKEYVEKIWGWDEEFQQKSFAADFAAQTGEIVVVEGTDAGFWWTIEKENEILLASVRLLPEFQNKGIGTKLIKELIANSQKPIRLQVLKVNPARRLYEKLGFRFDGENATHYSMKRDSA